MPQNAPKASGWRGRPPPGPFAPAPAPRCPGARRSRRPTALPRPRSRSRLSTLGSRLAAALHRLSALHSHPLDRHGTRSTHLPTHLHRAPQDLLRQRERRDEVGRQAPGGDAGRTRRQRHWHHQLICQIRIASDIRAGELQQRIHRLVGHRLGTLPARPQGRETPATPRGVGRQEQGAPGIRCLPLADLDDRILPGRLESLQCVRPLPLGNASGKTRHRRDPTHGQRAVPMHERKRPKDRPSSHVQDDLPPTFRVESPPGDSQAGLDPHADQEGQEHRLHVLCGRAPRDVCAPEERDARRPLRQGQRQKNSLEHQCRRAGRPDVKAVLARTEEARSKRHSS